MARNEARPRWSWAELAWVVDPEAATVEVWVRDREEPARFVQGETLACVPAGGSEALHLPVDEPVGGS